MADGGAEVAAVPPSGAANGLSNGAGGALAQTGNPLSRKLNKILETRLDNDKVPGLAGPGPPAASRPRPAVGVDGAAHPRGPTRPGKSEEVP